MKEWYTPAEFAALGLKRVPNTERGVRDLADREGWRRPDLEYPANPHGCWRKREGRGGGFEYRISVLPTAARLQLTAAAAKAKRVEPIAAETIKGDLRRSSLWAHYHRLSDRQKAEAKRKLEVLDAVEELVRNGTAERTYAYMLAASDAKIGLRTLYAWRDQVAGVPREDWLAALAPRYVGRTREAECSPEALAFIKTDYLRPERPAFTDCYRRLARAAAEHGWKIPSERTLQRRIEALGETQKVLARDGVEALARLYPAQERDKSTLHALECVNADGHRWDVFARWSDGTIGRPVMVAFQDVHSGMILSWRIDRSENAHAVLLAFGDLVETWGIPEHVVLDNGRNFASKWIAGGVSHRFRFKVRADEPHGVMTTLGVQVHWATPYHGQAKPIERAFRDMASAIAKDPRFAGAYTGNKVDAKPENYGSKAVPIDLFETVVGEGIAEHNARLGRRSKVCAGQSFEQVFRASYEASLIRKASLEQKQLWLLAAEGVSVRRGDGIIHLMGNRYWCDGLADLRGTKVVARFDPDALHDGVHVYRLDGTYVAHAECIHAEGFVDVDAARRHGAAKKAYLKAHKAQLDAERTMSLTELANLLPTPTPAQPAPETRVIRPVFSRGGAAAAVAVRQDHELSQAETLAAFGRGLRLVRNEDDAAG